MNKQALPWLSFLDALRPDPGWQVDVAVLTTYSADCASIVATILALAGRDDDRGSGSKVDFAEAFEHLNSRLHVLLQSGRLAVPNKRLPVLRLLDRFVVPVEADERQHSWHPKLTLLRLSNPEEQFPQWRLWVSSRNLTRDRSLDTGLLMVGTVHGKGTRLKGIDDVGRRLFTLANHGAAAVEAWAEELSKVAWLAPEGVTPIEIRLPNPSDPREFPVVPGNASEIVVVSPFLDVAAVKYLGSSGRKDAQRTLVSTSAELSKLSSRKNDGLQGYARKLQFEAPPLDAGGPDYVAMELADEDGEERQEDGLHAKIIMAKTGDSWTTWIGSTNATERGWKKNHELVLNLACTQRVADSLFHQFDLAKEFDPGLIDADLLTEDEAEKQLEQTRTQLLNEWIPSLRYVVERGALESKDAPPIAQDIHLEVGWLGGVHQQWLRDVVSLPLLHRPDEGDSELFEFALRLGDLACSWIQRIAWNRPLPEDRDMRLMARFLDHRTFMQWLRDLMTQQALTDGGGDWDGEPVRRQQRRASGGWVNLSWMPTLEEVLKASVQQPQVLATIDRKLQAYLAHMPDDIPEEDLAALKEFEGVWHLVRRELVNPS